MLRNNYVYHRSNSWIMLITVLGNHKYGVISSNAGEFQTINGHLYDNLTGYWVLRPEHDGRYSIVEFINNHNQSSIKNEPSGTR
jgi:hypothetical protein